MNDDDLTRLASAYLDDEATADERAQVDADEELLAEVERLRTVRILLATVDAPSISMREVHLAGALDAWDRLPEAERTGVRRDAAGIGAATVSAPRRSGHRRQLSSTRWLTAAAAGLIVVLAGGVALKVGTSGNDESSTSADASAESQALTARADEAPAAVDEIGPPQPAGGAAADAATTGSKLDTGIDQAAPPAENAGLVQLLTPADLADFAAAAVLAPPVPDGPTATSATGDEDLLETESAQTDPALPLCLGADIIVGPAVYGDVAVVVGIDEGRDLAIAYRPATCTEVARVRLP